MTTQNIGIEKKSPALNMPRLFLHIEGLALLLSVIVIYANRQFNWWAFALFLLAPDLAMLFYFINKRMGSLIYNLVHNLIFPLALAIFSNFNGSDLGLQIALIWLAHIGMDRTVGYGFKYAGQFKETHFSRI